MEKTGLLRAELMEILSYMRQMKKPIVGMMGNQTINAELDDLIELCTLYGFTDIANILADKVNKTNIIEGHDFFKAAGADEVYALDYSAYEGADIIFDLNSKNLPCTLKNAFDIVIDGGTLEHIFHPGIALKNMADMVKPGGLIYHMIPCAGLVNHGFYSFSPTFFQDYYSVNGFKIDSLRMQYKPEQGIYKFVFYSMDCRLFKTSDGINQYIQKYWNDGGEILLQCIAHKCISNDLIETYSTPIQGMYQKIYREWDNDSVSKKRSI